MSIHPQRLPSSSAHFFPFFFELVLAFCELLFFSRRRWVPPSLVYGDSFPEDKPEESPALDSAPNDPTGFSAAAGVGSAAVASFATGTTGGLPKDLVWLTKIEDGEEYAVS